MQAVFLQATKVLSLHQL